MTADDLIRFYPRAWRERYGAEFLDMVGPQRLHPQQIMDIAMGAIDAWLSADVRRARQPWRAQALVLGVTFALLIAAGYLSILI